jgi:pyridoxal phosphate enzyme (YggS family)
MSINKENYIEIIQELKSTNVMLVAVSKTKSIHDIKELYDLGHRDFGENYVQEMVDKYHELPKDIRWHFIGHLQTNKVKYIAPFAHLIQSVDSWKLLKEINKQSEKINRVSDVLLQIHISEEETKFGLDKGELHRILNADSIMLEGLKNVRIVGFMGMASFTENKEGVRKEFHYLKTLFDQYVKLQTANYQFKILSMGMSNDYKLAIEEGSNLVRIGSLIFGERN